MVRKYGSIHVLMEVPDSNVPVGADAVADAMAEELQSDELTRWADKVRAAIASAPRMKSKKLPVSEQGETQRRKSSIEAQIAQLQRELVELGGSRHSV